MAVSTNLERLIVSESQAAKATATNTSLEAVEEALTETYNLDTTGGGTITIPFDDTNDLSSRQALRYILLVLDAGAAGDFNVEHPANKHMFVCRNDTPHVATIRVAGQTGITLQSNATALLYCNGTDITELDVSQGADADLTVPLELQMNYVGSPPASTVIAKFLNADPIDFAADFAGSVGEVPVNPGATYDIDVQDDGVSIGTISISSGGVFTFTTTSNTAKTVASGSILTFVSDATPDGALTEINVALRGTR